jgi:hypothetical protein
MQHIKNVPRRKTDVKDPESIAERLAHDLIRSSLIGLRRQFALKGRDRRRKSCK